MWCCNLNARANKFWSLKGLKKIAKLQAKFMELYGETPEGDSNDEGDTTQGITNQPFQAVKVANWIFRNKQKFE